MSQPNRSAAISTSGLVNRPSRFEAPYWSPSDRNQSQNDQLSGWIRDAVAEGDWFLRSQTGYRFIDNSYRIMNDIGFDELPPTMSRASANFVKRDVRELIGLLANPRPITSFKCGNPSYDQQALILNQLYMSWYQACFVDRSIRQALQYAAIEGTGYLLTGWNPGYWSGYGDVSLEAGGADMVLPIQINPQTWDLQSAYAVIIRRQLPIFEVIRRYPHLADKIKPDGESVHRLRRLMGAVEDKVSPTVHNTYGSQRGYRNEDPATRNLVTIYDIYLQDRMINESGQTIKMGIEGSAWEYEVPAVGSDIVLPAADPQSGQPLTRKATIHDSRVFPYRRHIVATRTLILSDGPSKYWHGEAPVVKFTLDDWIQEYCGVPITKEPAKVLAASRSILRAYDDSANARLRPDLIYDENRTNPAEAQAIDTRIGGKKIGASDLLGPIFKPAIDIAAMAQAPDALQYIQWCHEQGARLIGVPDLRDAQKAAQIPSGDALEKLQELNGALVTDFSRNMEASLRVLGNQFKAYVFEFYTAARRYQLMGLDGLTPQDYDFDPTELVPDDIRIAGLNQDATRFDRARAHMQNFQFSIVPNSVYAMTQSTRRLLLLTLQRSGLPISPYTILEQFDIPNPGRPPVGPDGSAPVTEIDRWKAWKAEETDIALAQQAKMAEAQMAMQAQATQSSPLGQIAGAIQQAVHSDGGHQVGRPPTAQKMPHPEIKDGGTRVAISES